MRGVAGLAAVAGGFAGFTTGAAAFFTAGFAGGVFGVAALETAAGATLRTAFFTGAFFTALVATFFTAFLATLAGVLPPPFFAAFFTGGRFAALRVAGFAFAARDANPRAAAFFATAFFAGFFFAAAFFATALPVADFFFATRFMSEPRSRLVRTARGRGPS